MSIENVSGRFSRSARTLIINRAPEAKRLRSFRTLAFLMSLLAIDMQVLTDLKSKELAASCAVREQAIPNYRNFRQARTIVARGMARDRPSPYGSRGVHRRAGDRPPQGLTAVLLREPFLPSIVSLGP